MKANKGPAPGFINHRSHAVRITASDQRWTTRLGELVLATSTRTQVLRETGYEPVVYFPAEDVSMSLLMQTEDRSTCPFNGDAHYYVSTASKDGRPIAWSYGAVFNESARIKDHVAFFIDRVELLQELVRQI
jgi:uncharacterized protein (DUF427 family)